MENRNTESESLDRELRALKERRERPTNHEQPFGGQERSRAPLLFGVGVLICGCAYAAATVLPNLKAQILPDQQYETQRIVRMLDSKAVKIRRLDTERRDHNEMMLHDAEIKEQSAFGNTSIPSAGVVSVEDGNGARKQYRLPQPGDATYPLSYGSNAEQEAEEASAIYESMNNNSVQDQSEQYAPPAYNGQQSTYFVGGGVAVLSEDERRRKERRTEEERDHRKPEHKEPR